MWPKQKMYEFSNKPHRMLVNKLCTRPFYLQDLLIQAYVSPTHCPQTMTQVFGDFYRKLYNCITPENHFNFTQDNFDQFVENLSLPKLTSSDLEKLNTPISPEELAKIVKDLPLHKSPGPDGLPYHYYKTFLTTLTLNMLELFGTLLHGDIPHSQFTHSYISVIHKPGKDPSLPDNYRLY